MRFLLIGGIGYLGGRLANYLKQQGHYVRVTTRRPLEDVPSWLQADDVVRADPLNAAAWPSAFSSIDMAIHLASPNEIVSTQNPREALRAGGEATWNILQALSEQPHPPALIYLSTVHIYGSNARGLLEEGTRPSPAHPYALGKYVGECVVQSFRQKRRLEGVCVRLSNTFGAPTGYEVPRWTLVFNDLCRQAVLHQQIVLKSTGTQKRNFIPLSDAVRALEFLALHRSHWPADGAIHLGSNQTWSIRQAADKVSQLCREVLGYDAPVIVPPDARAEDDQEFQFSFERLQKLGFTWEDETEKEIRETLILCRDSGPRLNHPLRS
jgi:UDP-glucose 4-epimerase